MIERVEIGRLYPVTRDGTGEEFVARVERLDHWVRPIAILTLTPPRQLLIDATKGKLGLMSRIVAMERYRDEELPGYPPFPIPVNLFRVEGAEIVAYANQWGPAFIEEGPLPE